MRKYEKFRRPITQDIFKYIYDLIKSDRDVEVLCNNSKEHLEYMKKLKLFSKNDLQEYKKSTEDKLNKLQDYRMQIGNLIRKRQKVNNLVFFINEYSMEIVYFPIKVTSKKYRLSFVEQDILTKQYYMEKEK